MDLINLQSLPNLQPEYVTGNTSQSVYKTEITDMQKILLEASSTANIKAFSELRPYMDKIKPVGNNILIELQQPAGIVVDVSRKKWMNPAITLGRVFAVSDYVSKQSQWSMLKTGAIIRVNVALLAQFSQPSLEWKDDLPLIKAPDGKEYFEGNIYSVWAVPPENVLFVVEDDDE
jgi:hypothetical protein